MNLDGGFQLSPEVAELARRFYNELCHAKEKLPYETRSKLTASMLEANSIYIARCCQNQRGNHSLPVSTIVRRFGIE